MNVNVSHYSFIYIYAYLNRGGKAPYLLLFFRNDLFCLEVPQLADQCSSGSLSCVFITSWERQSNIQTRNICLTFVNFMGSDFHSELFKFQFYYSCCDIYYLHFEQGCVQLCFLFYFPLSLPSADTFASKIAESGSIYLLFCHTLYLFSSLLIWPVHTLN